MIRTVIGEADDQPDRGKAAVAHTILNRVADGRWGDTPSKVVLARGQFEPWQTRAAELNKIDPESRKYQRTGAIVDDVTGGKIPDPTNGATHFLDPVIVRRRRGGSLPDWASGDGVAIGDHTFYRPGQGGGQQAISAALKGGPAASGLPAAATAFDEPDVLSGYGIIASKPAPAAPPGDDILGGYGVTLKPGAQPAAAPPAPKVMPGTMVMQPGGKVTYEPGDVTTPAEQTAGAKRGLPAQFVGGIPIAGPAINAGTAAADAAIPRPGEEGKGYGQRFSSRLHEQSRADKAFAEQNPISATAAQFAGGSLGYGAGAATAPGRLLMGMTGPSLPARIYGGVLGGAGINAADALLRGENPIPAAEVGAAGGVTGPALGEGAAMARRGLSNWMTRPKTGPLADLPPHALRLLTERGLGDLSPAEISQLRSTAGPNAFLGDLTPGLRDITTGVSEVQGTGRDLLRRAYQDRHAQGAQRLDDILTRHLGPTNNIVDYTNMLTENRARAADPLYAQWRSTQVQPTPELKALIPRLEKAGAFNAAEELAGIEGKSINRNFFTTNPATQRSGVVSAYPTTETWDLVKQGLDRRIDAAYSAGDKRLGRSLVGLKQEMIGEIEKTPAGQIWRQARQEFADRSALIDQVNAGRDTLLGGRSGMTVDELREELKHLSGPELQARRVGLRSALHEDMGETQNGAARVGGRLLTDNAQQKLRLMLGGQRANRMIDELRQEATLRERLPYVVQNPNTGASAVSRGESRELFRAPEPVEWKLNQPSTLPIVGGLSPWSVLNDLRVAGRARSAPALAPLLTKSGTTLDDLIKELSVQRDRLAANARKGSVMNRLTTATTAGPAVSTYRRYYENQRADQ